MKRKKYKQNNLFVNLFNGYVNFENKSQPHVLHCTVDTKAAVQI